MRSIAPPTLDDTSVVEGFTAGQFVQQLSACFGIQIRREQLIPLFA
jgi:hypothetical protein